jgi:hypothetical protein
MKTKYLVAIAMTIAIALMVNIIAIGFISGDKSDIPSQAAIIDKNSSNNAKNSSTNLNATNNGASNANSVQVQTDNNQQTTVQSSQQTTVQSSQQTTVQNNVRPRVTRAS